MTKKKKPRTDWKVICVGMACLTVCELYALHMGINGTMFAVYVGIIAGAIGLSIDNPLKK